MPHPVPDRPDEGGLLFGRLGNGHLAPGMAVLTKPFPTETTAPRIRSMIEAKR